MSTWKIIAVIILVLVAGLAIMPKQNEVKRLKEGKNVLQTQSNQLIKDLQKLDEMSKQKVDEKNELLEIIPIGTQQDVIIGDLKRISEQTSFTIDSLSFSRGFNEQVNAPELKITFSTEGPKKFAEDFLAAIENNKRFMGMETLKINNDLEKTTSSFSVSLYSFYQEKAETK